ncbi:hypothetical protein PR048_030477 [Dryococelus australis]|uniref:Uncharacterized protein n=1 Tax=Dryococelus australis TaxID=614101 RepID=A0ABQ9GCY8_9NEOP|nr:hypothetical protein PR048_030477 [Dryococelus australis]
MKLVAMCRDEENAQPPSDSSPALSLSEPEELANVLDSDVDPEFRVSDDESGSSASSRSNHSSQRHRRKKRKIDRHVSVSGANEIDDVGAEVRGINATLQERRTRKKRRSVKEDDSVAQRTSTRSFDSKTTPQKKMDLLDLLPLIPATFHEFYKGLPISSDSNADIHPYTIEDDENEENV